MTENEFGSIKVLTLINEYMNTEINEWKNEIDWLIDCGISLTGCHVLEELVN